MRVAKTMLSAASAAALAAGVLGLAACERAALEGACPDVVAGGLVITEVRGPQSGDDTYGQWIEIHNASGAAVSLGGLRVRELKLDGSSPVEFLVRDPELTVAAGGYAVLGRFVGALPAHVDYGYAGDLDGDLYASAVLEISACGALIDRVTWTDLPQAGSWSFAGAPSATGNDDTAAWCADARAAMPPPPDQLGLPGSPGQENPACP